MELGGQVNAQRDHHGVEEQRQIEEFLSTLRKCNCYSDVKQESTSEARLATEKILEFRIGLTSEPIRGNTAPISYASNQGT